MFGAYYRSSFPENLATSSRRFVLQTFIFFLDSMSLEYPNNNQIWISGRYDGWNFSRIYDVGPDRVDVLADTPSRKVYYRSILNEKFVHLFHDDSVRLILEVVP